MPLLSNYPLMKPTIGRAAPHQNFPGWKLTLLNIIALLLFILLLPAFGIAQETIRIGVLTDLSGPAAYYGQSTRVGALLAERELQRKGENIQLIFEDSALNTQRGLTAAQKLLFVDKVHALAVDFNSIAIAVSRLAQQQKTLMLYHSAAESVAQSNPFAFKTYSNYRVGCGLIAREMKKRGLQRVGVLYAEAEYGELCLAGVKSVLQPLSYSYKQGENVGTQILRLKKDKVQAIINASYESDIENMLRAASDLKMKVRFGINEDVFTPALRERFKNLIEGTLTFAPRDPSPRFLENVKTIEGASSLKSFEGAAEAYVHIKQLYWSAKPCTGKPKECLPEELAKSPADEDIGFEGWHNRMAKLQLSLKEYRNGTLFHVASSSNLE